MKINTISAYVLVYLLARGHWNLMVPVRAVEESDASSASTSGDAGSTAGGEADGSTPAAPEAPEGSTASPDAGLTAGEGSGHVAGGSDADGTAGSSPEGASSGDASNGAGLASGEGVDGGSSGHASTGAELGSLYPDFYTGGVSADEAPITSPDFIAGKKEAAKRMADDARKAAEEAIKAAEKMRKAAEDLTEAIDKTDNTIEIEAEMQKLSAAVEDSVYVVNVSKSIVVEDADPLDMTYYSGFPNGWHFYNDGTEEQFVEREKKWLDNMEYYSGFPDGHHSFDYDTLKEVSEREKMLTANLMYYRGFPDGWHFGNPLVLRDIRRHELKGEIAAKKKEIESLNKVIIELTTQMEKIDAEVKKLEEEHNDLVLKLLGFDALLIKLYKADAEGNLVLMEENTDFDKKKSQGDLRFVIKDGVKCTKVMYDVHEIWKKGERDVEEPKLVAFNDNVGVLAIRDENRAVLFKKETNSDKWYYHNTVVRKTAGTPSRTAAQTGSSAGSTLASSSALAGSKMNLEAGSTGTPETPESLDDTASVASGEGSEPNEADSGTALRGSTVGSADGGSSSGGEAATEYSSVFME